MAPRPTSDYPSLGAEDPTDAASSPVTEPTAPPAEPGQDQTPAADLRERLLADCVTLRVPLRAEQLDAALSRAEHDGLTHLQFVQLLLGEQADQRRERSIAHRIRDARFRDPHTLEGFDWQFNAATIHRTQIEELATGDFIRRKDNLVLVGQSGVGKSRIIQSIGRAACAQGLRVRYTTSGGLIEDLTAALADQTLPRRLRYYAGFDLLIVDEFGFDRLERREAPRRRQSAVQDDRRPDAETLDRPGDEHRLRRLGRLPGRPAPGDGLAGPDRGRGDHRENQRQIVPGAPGPTGRRVASGRPVACPQSQQHFLPQTGTRLCGQPTRRLTSHGDNGSLSGGD